MRWASSAWPAAVAAMPIAMKTNEKPTTKAALVASTRPRRAPPRTSLIDAPTSTER